MNNAEPIIATWLVADSVEEQSGFPQVSGDSSSPTFQAVYWRCVACLFATLIKVNAPGRRVLFTNVERLPVIDGIAFDTLLKQFGVEIWYLPTVRRLRHPAIQKWANQFYILDIIAAVEPYRDFSSLIVLDADCIWVRSADELLVDLSRFGV